MKAMENLLQVVEIAKSFGKKTVISEVSFALKRGEVLVLVGENGAGKSTLLSIITTLLKPDKGEVIFTGEDIIKKPKSARGCIAYIPQEIALHNHLTVKDNLNFWASMSGLSKAEKKSRSQTLLQDFHLTEYADDKVEKLSVGLRRRISIAVALFSNAQLLIMDEPTAGLDRASENEIFEFVRSQKEQGKAVIYVTHIAKEIEMLADKVLHIDRGVGRCYESVSAYEEATQVQK